MHSLCILLPDVQQLSTHMCTHTHEILTLVMCSVCHCVHCVSYVTQLHLTPARVILSLPIPAAAQVDTTDRVAADDTTTASNDDGATAIAISTTSDNAATDSGEANRVHVDLDVTLSAHANARVMYEAKKRYAHCSSTTIAIY
jgi:hypothetical protein